MCWRWYYTKHEHKILRGRSAGGGYFNQKMCEKYFILASAGSSIDVELLAINTALVCCLMIDDRMFLDSKAPQQALVHYQPNNWWVKVPVVPTQERKQTDGSSVDPSLLWDRRQQESRCNVSIMHSVPLGQGKYGADRPEKRVKLDICN